MMRTQALPNCCATRGAMNSSSAATAKPMYLFFMVFDPFASGAVCHAFAEKPLRTQRQHEDQNNEREDVLVVAAEQAAGEGADVAGADRFDQPEQDAAHHGAGQVADAPEHRGRKRLES